MKTPEYVCISDSTSTLFMQCWKCGSPFHKPIGMRCHWYRLSSVQKPVMGTESGCMGTYQKPDFRSSFQKTLCCPTTCTMSSAHSKGIESRTVWLFIPLQFTTRQSLVDHGLGTANAGAAQGPLPMLTSPHLIISLISLRTKARCGLLSRINGAL